MMNTSEKVDNGIGHNSSRSTLRIEVRLFNSLSRYGEPGRTSQVVDVEAGATVGDLVRLFKLPLSKIFLTLRNGRDITPGLYQGGKVNEDVLIHDGDVIAFSGPVPYSYGYGAPVV